MLSLLYFHRSPHSLSMHKMLNWFELITHSSTGNKSFIMLDRWNKLSHDSSNSTIGIFTLSHHTKDICNPLQCKHMIQRHVWMLENKPTYPPKMKQNKPAFCSRYLLVQLGAHLLNIFKTNFHRWMTKWELLLSRTLYCCDSTSTWAWLWMWK